MAASSADLEALLARQQEALSTLEVEMRELLAIPAPTTEQAATLDPRRGRAVSRRGAARGGLVVNLRSDGDGTTHHADAHTETREI